MRMLLIMLVLLALALSASTVWAAVGAEDGWAGWPGAATGLPDVGPLNGTYWTNWAGATGATNGWTGWWDVDDSRWVPVDGAGGDDGLELTAFIELYASQTQQTEGVFHWGAPPFGPLDCDLVGSIVSNHPCWVGIRKDGWVEASQADASHLSFVKDAWNRAAEIPGYGGTSADIPLVWSMSVGGGGFAPMEWSGGVGAANWGWYSADRLPVGATNYTFRVTATPNPYQADGIYTLDPQVIVVPDL